MVNSATTTLSNVDLVKHYVYQNEPVEEDDIVEYIRDEMGLDTLDEARDRVELALKNQDYFYKKYDEDDEGESIKLWRISKNKLPEHQVVHEVLKDAHTFLTERDIKRKIAEHLDIKYSQVVIDMERVSGVQKYGNRWGLEEWEIVNDLAVEILEEHERGMQEADVIKLALEKDEDLDPDNVIFSPETDDRFAQEGNQWDLKERLDRKKQTSKADALDLKPREKKESSLEQGFAEVIKESGKESGGGGGGSSSGGQKKDSDSDSQLKKVLKKKVRERLQEERERSERDPGGDRAALLGLEGDEYDRRSFNRIETLPRERRLDSSERQEILDFLTDLANRGSEEDVKIRGPLSVRKVQDLLFQNYAPYSKSRAQVPRDFNRYLAALVAPKINELILNPAAGDGTLAVSVTDHVYDSLEKGRWSADDDGFIDIITDQDEVLSVDAADTPLLDEANESGDLSQHEFIDHFLAYNFVSLEPDELLAQAARYIAELSGYPEMFYGEFDFFTELEEVFHGGEVLDFDLITGNYTYREDPNLTANYIDHSLEHITEDGRVGCFVSNQFVQLLGGHDFLEEIQERARLHHLIKLPNFGGVSDISLLTFDGPERSEEEFTVAAEPRDIETLNSLIRELRETDDPSGLDEVSIVEPDEVASILS